MSDQYYVDIDGKTAGPFTIGQLRDLYAGGKINQRTIWTTPQSVEWQPIGLIIPLLAATSVPVAPPQIQQVIQRPGMICDKCGGKLVATTHFKCGTILAVIGYLLIIGGIPALFFACAGVIPIIVGCLLVMKNKVWQCVACGATSSRA